MMGWLFDFEGQSNNFTQNALKVSCGHTFWIFLNKAYPIAIKNAVMAVPEVVKCKS
jgi:adenosine/AMP kinase